MEAIQNEKCLTLSVLKQNKAFGLACQGRFWNFKVKLGDYDSDRPLRLIKILQLSGVGDCLWSFQYFKEGSIRKLLTNIILQMASWSAHRSLPFFEGIFPEDVNPRNAVESIVLNQKGDLSKLYLKADYSAEMVHRRVIRLPYGLERNRLNVAKSAARSATLGCESAFNMERKLMSFGISSAFGCIKEAHSSEVKSKKEEYSEMFSSSVSKVYTERLRDLLIKEGF